jgi:hypothetical protein
VWLAPSTFSELTVNRVGEAEVSLEDAEVSLETGLARAGTDATVTVASAAPSIGAIRLVVECMNFNVGDCHSTPLIARVTVYLRSRYPVA